MIAALVFIPSMKSIEVSSSKKSLNIEGATSMVIIEETGCE